jgi:hypothetical protein
MFLSQRRAFRMLRGSGSGSIVDPGRSSGRVGTTSYQWYRRACPFPIAGCDDNRMWHTLPELPLDDTKDLHSFTHSTGGVLIFRHFYIYCAQNTANKVTSSRSTPSRSTLSKPTPRKPPPSKCRRRQAHLRAKRLTVRNAPDIRYSYLYISWTRLSRGTPTHVRAVSRFQ